MAGIQWRGCDPLRLAGQPRRVSGDNDHDAEWVSYDLKMLKRATLDGNRRAALVKAAECAGNSIAAGEGKVSRKWY